MNYIKISFIAIFIAIFIYYKFNEDNNNLFKDELSMFIVIDSHENLEDILFDLSSQIESFDDYIYNVYYSRDNEFLIENKLKLKFDADFIDYKRLLNSSNIEDFNIRIGNIIEDYFLNHHSSLHLTKKYLLRNFLIRINQYFKFQIGFFNRMNIPSYLKYPLEDFILGPKYISDFRGDSYIMKIEFIDLESMDKYKTSGMDSVFQSILDYNSKVFNSNVAIYNSNDSLIAKKFKFSLKQYVREFYDLEEAMSFHKDLMLSDNVFLVESIYDYYFNNTFKYEDKQPINLHPSILDSSYAIDYRAYKNSLLFLEEKLIALQADDLTNDFVITSLLNDLVGDGKREGSFSNYIDRIDVNSHYILDDLNRSFSYEIQTLFNKVSQAEVEFDTLTMPAKIKKYLFPQSVFKIRYFIEE